MKVKPSFHEKLFQKKKKKNYCYGFVPGDFHVICGSMVGENRRSRVSTETPGFICYMPQNNGQALEVSLRLC